MSTLPSELIRQTLDCLKAISDSAEPPTRAQQRLREVEAADPGVRVDLLWDDGGDGASWHYDALLRLPGGGTISLSYCPDRALPWPLRGARRFREGDLLRVNDNVMTVGEAIGRLDATFADAAVGTRLIDACLVQEELLRHPVEVSAQDLQRAMDAFRRTHRLYSAEACRQWMAQRGLSPTQFEALIAEHAEVAALRRRVTAQQGFDDWLAGRRAAARIEWFWHDAA